MKKRTRIRIGIIVVIVGLMGFSDLSFAAESESDGLKILGMGLNLFVSVLGWIWVFFAKLAGTFLTNKWVYGETLGLDSLLWQYRNVMKNIANFGLGFYFVYVIFNGLINQGKDDITKKLKNIILWLLIAGVGIQASRFFVATVIDISTITLAAAGSFPSQVLSESPYAENAMKTSLREYLNSNGDVGQGKQVSLFPKDQDASSLIESKPVSLVNVESLTGLVDTLMPNADDVSGPLYFIGFTILKTDVITSIDSSSDNGIKGTILNTIIQGGTTVVFAIEMLVLCVLSLIRIIYLWMFIVLSPLAILIWCIEKSGEKLGNGDGFLSKFTSQISLKTFFINVFKPTFIVLCFGVALIFVMLLNKLILDFENKCFDMKGVVVCGKGDLQSNANGNKGDKTYSVDIDNDFLHFTLANSGRTLLELVFSVLTVLIVYLIIDFAVRMGNGKDFVSKSIGRLQDGLGNIIKSAPVIPVPSYDEYGKQKGGGALSRNGLQSLSSDGARSLRKGFDAKVSKQTDDVLKMWKIGGGNALTQEQKMDIVNAGAGSAFKGLQILEEKKKKIVKTEEGMGMSFASNARDGGFWRGEFEGWLTSMKDRKNEITGNNYQSWRDMVTWWNNPSNKNRSLENLFANSNYVKAYAALFGLGNITTWTELVNKDISKK